MVRETSIESFHEIKNNGLLTGRRLEVYSALYLYGPCTASELFYQMQKRRNPTHSNVTTRLGELREMGVVKEVGQKQCSITQMTVIEWDVTKKLPTKLKKVKRVDCPWCKGTGHYHP